MIEPGNETSLRIVNEREKIATWIEGWCMEPLEHLECELLRRVAGGVRRGDYDPTARKAGRRK